MRSENLDAAQVIAELVEIAKEMRKARSLVSPMTRKPRILRLKHWRFTFDYYVFWATYRRRWIESQNSAGHHVMSAIPRYKPLGHPSVLLTLSWYHVSVQ
jgi:hypothetical protein